MATPRSTSIPLLSRRLGSRHEHLARAIAHLTEAITALGAKNAANAALRARLEALRDSVRLEATAAERALEHDRQGGAARRRG
jgi:hypothetical protein